MVREISEVIGGHRRETFRDTHYDRHLRTYICVHVVRVTRANTRRDEAMSGPRIVNGSCHAR